MRREASSRPFTVGIIFMTLLAMSDMNESSLKKSRTNIPAHRHPPLLCGNAYKQLALQLQISKHMLIG